MFWFAVVVAGLSWVRSAPAQETEAEVNVALGKTYTCTSEGGIAWRGLLDGVVDSDAPPGCFATGNDADFPKKIVIDLSAVYRIDQVVVHNSANGNTKKVDVWASRDGQSYTQLRQPYVFPQGVAQRMSAKFPALEARYVKIALWDTWGGGLGGDNILYLREVEVLGRPTPLKSGTKARPEIPRTAPRLGRLVRRYVLQQGRDVRLVVIGDDLVAGRNGAPDLAAVLADRLKTRFLLGEVKTTDDCKPQLTARAAGTLALPVADEAPDLVVVALGTTDSLAFDPGAFREAVSRLLHRLLDETEAFVVVIAPPRLPHVAELGRFGECATADTADPAWQLAGLVPGLDLALIDGDAVLQESGLPNESAYADNLSLSSAGLEALAGAVVTLFAGG